MATSLTLENVLYVPQHLWRVNFELPKYGEWTVQAYAKDMHIVNGEVLGEKQKPTINRKLFNFDGTPTDACMESVTLPSGKTISMLEVIQAGALFGDKWREEDDTPPVVAEPTPEEPPVEE